MGETSIAVVAFPYDGGHSRTLKICDYAIISAVGSGSKRGTRDRAKHGRFQSEAISFHLVQTKLFASE